MFLECRRACTLQDNWRSNLSPALYAPCPRFSPHTIVQNLAIETADSFFFFMTSLPTNDTFMKPLREVLLQNSKDGGPDTLYYFDFNDLIKSLLKQEAAKGLMPFSL